MNWRGSIAYFTRVMKPAETKGNSKGLMFGVFCSRAKKLGVIAKIIGKVSEVKLSFVVRKGIMSTTFAWKRIIWTMGMIEWELWLAQWTSHQRAMQDDNFAITLFCIVLNGVHSFSGHLSYIVVPYFFFELNGH